MRLSDYSIFSDALPNGDRVLLNGCSGALDLVPRILADYLLQARADGGPGRARVDDEKLHPETVAGLLERGHLTRGTPLEERALVHEIARGLHEEQRRRPCFMIAPSLGCNYRCVYCFERPLQASSTAAGRTGTRGEDQPVLRPKDVPRIFDCIARIQDRAGTKPGGMIILYGGEPLDARHRSLVFEIVRTGRSRGYYFAVVTNGHDLDRFIPVIGPDLIRQIQVTFDGPRPLHDRRRIARDGSSSFDRLVANIHAALEVEGVDVHLRVHVEPGATERFGELIAFFEQEGWTDHPSVIIYASTLYQKDEAGHVCARVDVADLAARLDQVAGRYRNVLTSAPGVHVARALISAFESDRRYPLKADYCSANFGNYIFAPDGCTYACWESIGRERGRTGRYRGRGEPALDTEALERWFDRSVVRVRGCLECEFALVCGGGCAQYAQYNAGSINEAFCDSFQRVFRGALADEAVRYFGKERKDDERQGTP